MDVHKKKHNFIVFVHTSARWVKPTEPIFLTPTLLMGNLLGEAGELAISLYGTCSSKPVLPVSSQLRQVKNAGSNG